MRELPIRRLASTALFAALLLGVAGPSALAADGDPATREHGAAASRAPVPGADTLLGQSGNLADLGTVLTPATGLLTAVAKADDGQLTAEQATELGEAVKEAITGITGVGSPASSATPSPQTLPAEAEPAADPRTDVLDALRLLLDDLLAVITSGDAAKVGPAAQSMVTGLADLLTVTREGL
ncbi:hypothetical protein [Streptomyces sp. B93]|uniref:hypothetical protein n=1 Tax=Streptomyces sp. B93 TaxID=2824875 RepID=UPI001B398269|nr:hypothetical protein [Streptomyces sp. B93]MBQ1090746.1 hypothetical protein [Streptomyces sp. B93]